MSITINSKSKIKVQCKCSECAGSGIITNPIWIDLYNYEENYRKENNNQNLSHDEVKKWFSDKGLDIERHPEEVQCSECEGAGVIEEWVNIIDLRDFIYEV